MANLTRLPRRIARNTSVVTRLSLVVLVVSLVSLVITSIVGLQRGGDLADGVLRDRINALGATRAGEVELYVSALERAAIAQAISPSTAEAIDDFAAAYRELQVQGPSQTDEKDVDQYYLDTVAPELSAVRDRPISAAGLIPQAPAAVYLQANYVVRAGGDDAILLGDAGDGSRWSQLHDDLHQSFSEVAIQTGVDDLYLIEPTNHTIVYSVAKDIDFATSLLTGPQSGSSLAILINSFGDRPERGTAKIRDFTSYTAAGGEPSAFVASPVIANGSLAGFVAFRISPEGLNAITTDNGSWSGEGETEQTYLVARDGLMRSDARDFVEGQTDYLAAVHAAGAATDDQLRLMRRFGTNVLFQPVDDQHVDAALDQAPGLADTSDYLGVDVLQARRALDIDGVEWAMIAQVERQELEQPIVDFTRNLLIAIAIFLVAITFLAVRWSDRLLQPVRVISANLRGVRAGVDSGERLSSATLPNGSASEFVALADDIDTMLTTLNSRNADARARSDERRQLLQRLLPPQAAQRAEAGERDVIDQITNTTIAVLLVRGLGPLLRSGSKNEARLLLDRFVEEADVLAKQRGLERIRLTGDSYVAGCGTVRPHIDHAARTLAFVLDVRELLRDLSDDASQTISISAGVDSGPVTVGLTGGTGLVYDAWGATVQRAAELAQRATPDTVLVSTSTRTQLPTTFTIDDDSSIAVPDAVVVTGRSTDPEPAR
jgi:class 3 adenylate cyclase